MTDNKIAVFKGKEIRRVIHKDEWWFVIQDVVAVLTDSADPRQYIKKVRQRDPELDSYWGTICTPLEVTASDGKARKMNSANAEGLFRIIQSIPSPKAEPFKRWLAKVGYERVQEIEDPELATKRSRAFYKAKGYSEDWIEKRMRGIAIREELTDEWQDRGAEDERDYSILTAEISKATFGMTPSEYMDFKRLDRQNLRDHMNDLELIFSMLGERFTTEITRNEDSTGMPKLQSDAKRGGDVSGEARHKLENELGRPVVSDANYLQESEVQKRLEKK